jgi:hypothetical protein
VQVRRFAARLSEDLARAVATSDSERVICLRKDLSGRLIARAEASDDDDVVAALLEVGDDWSRPGAAMDGSRLMQR